LRRAAFAAVTVACPLVLAACSSSPVNPVSATKASGAPTASAAASASQVATNEGLGSAQAIAKFTAAVAAASAVHLTGTIIQSGQTTTVDIQINKDDTAKGTITSNGVTIPFIHAGGLGYIQYTKSLETTAKIDPNTQVGKLLLDKWAPSDTTLGASYDKAIAPIATLPSLAQFASGNGDPLNYMGVATVNGQQVAQYKNVSSTAGDPDTVLSFPVQGAMLPILISAGTSGNLNFVWNQPTTIAAPPAADLVTLKH
jgi:hypothetical protein